MVINTTFQQYFSYIMVWFGLSLYGDKHHFSTIFQLYHGLVWFITLW
jgi:hypothetical protein